MSYTTNPTWQDGTAGGTLVTAATLNHIEAGVLDASNRLDALGTTNADSVLRTELLGSQTRTTRVLFIAVGPSYSNAINTDIYAAGGWTISKDTDSGFHLGTSQADPSYWTVPLTRRYDVHFHVQGQAGASGSYLASKVERNSASVFSSSIASDINGTAAGLELVNDARVMAYPLSAGDKIYWSTWAGTSAVAIATAFGAVQTRITVRDAGPV